MGQRRRVGCCPPAGRRSTAWWPGRRNAKRIRRSIPSASAGSRTRRRSDARACVMDHRGECGIASRAHEAVVHAARVARRVMRRRRTRCWWGRRYAVRRINRVPGTNLLTPRAAEAYEKWKRTGERPLRANGAPPPSDHDTIGLLALDGRGVLAGACTTSGGRSSSRPRRGFADHRRRPVRGRRRGRGGRDGAWGKRS